MTTTTLLFILFYWPSVRFAQILKRLAQGKQLGSQHDTVISADFLSDTPYWIFYISVVIWLR